MTTKALVVPEGILEQHIVALGKTGSGKSSKLRVLVEHLLRQAKPVCIIDPKGDWWGLKLSKDGKGAGFPLVIFGGAHADVPLTEYIGEQVAEIVLSGNRPCILDLSEMMMGERARFYIDFAQAMFRKTKGRRYLVIDEVHNFAPKGKIMDPAAGKMLHWSNRLASEGRGKGLVLLAASQRPQKVHNDFLTSCETLIGARVIHKADRDAIKDWIDGCADPAIGKQLLNELASMPRTEAWVWSPEIHFGPKRIVFPMFDTYDSFKPRLELEQQALTGWASVNIDEIKTKLAAVIVESQKKSPTAMQARITELERALVLAKAKQYSQAEVDKLISVALQTAQVDVPAFRKSEFAAQEKALQQILEIARPFSPVFKSLNPIEFKPLSPQRTNLKAVPENSPTEKLSPTSRKILDTIHRSHPVALSFDTAATRAGVSKRSSALPTYKKQVMSSGEIVIREDGKLHSAPGFTAPVGAGVNPVEEFANKLPPSYARMLREIARAPAPLDRDDVAALAGVSPTSSGLLAGLSELVALGLVQQQPGGNYALHADLLGYRP